MSSCVYVLARLYTWLLRDGYSPFPGWRYYLFIHGFVLFHWLYGQQILIEEKRNDAIGGANCVDQERGHGTSTPKCELKYRSSFGLSYQRWSCL